jgi:DDE superfamily endonuclease/integrase-like protein
MTDEAMTPLRQRMIEDMRMRRLAPKTQKDYIQVIKNLAVFIGRSPDTASFEDIRRFQLQVAAGGVGAGAINRNVSARTAAAPIGGGSRNGNIRLFHSLDGAISQKLAQMVEDLGGAVRLVAAAPFWDGGSAIDDICAALGVREVFVHAHAGGSVEPHDPTRPVVCFDESPIQLIGEVRLPIRAKPGQIERYDCEYRRNGTANLFVFLDVHRPWRKVKATERRAAADFAACMREIADVHYPKAERIRLVLDNLSTHSAARSIRPSRLLKRGACCVGWSSITCPSTPAGSIWWKSRLASLGQPMPRSAHRKLRASCRRDRRLGKATQRPTRRIKWMFTTEKARERWAEPIQSLIPNRPGSKSRNLCDEVLVAPR